MGLEVERKWLVDFNKFSTLVKGKPDFIQQAYMLNKNRPSIHGAVTRIRIVNNQRAFLTRKTGTADAIAKIEEEYEIPVEAGRILFDIATEGIITKLRHTYEFDRLKFEVDQFLDKNTGLFIAECEFPTVVDAKAWKPETKPEWLLKEISGEVQYNNYRLATFPYEDWGKIVART